MLGVEDNPPGAIEGPAAPMPIPSIPDSAPFTPEQRAWLNGFLAAWAGVAEQSGSRLPSDLTGLKEAPRNGAGGANGAPPKKSAAKPVEPAAESAAVAVDTSLDDGDFAWHDPNLDIEERMKLAEGQGVTKNLMAAMAQLDCGACGYMCDTYAIAIASGKEKSTALCTPGGKETAKMLKKVVKDNGGIKPAPVSDAKATAVAVADGPIPYSRAKPYRARVNTLYNLNGEESAKHTCHVELDLAGSDISFRVGDSLGAFPTNCPDLVDEILFALKAHGTEHVTACDGVEAPLREALTVKSNLKHVGEDLVRLIASSTSDFDEKQRLRDLVDGDGDELDDMDVLDVLRLAPSARISKGAFSLTLGSLAPRLYSIASSLRAHPDSVHLTIAKVTTMLGGRERKGVASTMFTDRIGVGDTVRVFVQPSADFTLPSNSNAPMIMVGPGTGIAPFRAFLQERKALKARGKNWLFFGDQHEATDFLYKGELTEMQEQGLLTKLSTAFSRDQEEKIYVQQRMREEGAELYNWLEEGAWFFVCGDAKRMAGDVDRALHEIVAEHGGMSPEDAKKYVTNLRKTHRYVRDVY
ncbi:Sulfite reductase [NADPH] flavoprotein alpha-component [Posidoniimonas polymericola]|uniref:assimilatory sulfite reductase (NADPH) n=2 Tax=Posidoniimonas polymericola TaxID=2528002 RepID=A0A5C5YMH8_9BACT|nr:Sulfite reductase [NADPH] flavoprotein alpha-component [Posidoniimonas polymericola]